MSRVIVETGVNHENKTEQLQKLVERAGFLEAIETARVNKGLKHKDFKIMIKVNIAPASQINYHYFTDPVICDTLVEILSENNFKNLKVVESETNAVFAHPELKPDVIGKALNYKTPITDLSNTSLVQYSEFPVPISEIMVNADYRINLAKPKNHDLMFFTAALKNWYGCIPNPNKYRLFHKKESGYSIAEITALINYLLPAQFVFGDWVDSIDGNEVSYFKKYVESFPHFRSERLVASDSAYLFDQYVAHKMGYELEKCPILREYQNLTKERFLERENLISKIEGDDLDPLKDWKLLSILTNLKAKIQDLLPISDKIIAKGISWYRFPIIGKD